MINSSVKHYALLIVISLSLLMPHITDACENIAVWCGLTVCMVGVGCVGAWMVHADKKLTSLGSVEFLKL